MKKIAFASLLVALALGWGASAALAQDATQEAAAETPKPITATITGTNYNLADAYPERGTDAAEPKLTMLSAFKVSTAEDDSGKEIEGLVGKSVYYVPTAKATGLLIDESMRDVTGIISGTLHVEQRAIVIQDFTSAVASEEAGDDEWNEIIVGNMSQMPVLGNNPEEESTEPIGATLTGTNYNLLQSYAKDEAIGADPGLAKLNALRVTTAENIDGEPLESLVGKSVYYVPNDTAQHLLIDEMLQGKTLTVVGVLRVDQRAIIVETIEGIDDEDWVEIPTKGPSQVPVL